MVNTQNNYQTSHFWKIGILNPVSNQIIEENLFNTISEIHNKYNNINLNTWRNICMGRSKIYKKFINVEKIPKIQNNIDNSENTNNIIENNVSPHIVVFD